MSDLIAGISKLGRFSRKSKVDEDDVGDVIDANTVAGGGHASRQSAITKDQLRVSSALKSFLVKEGIFDEADVGLDSEQPSPVLREFLNKPHLYVPPEVTDRSHPLPDYFISSSHNTYLIAHQLFGESSAIGYETALYTGSRCGNVASSQKDLAFTKVVS